MTEHFSPRRPRPVLRPEDFPHHTSDIIRYGDLDPQGHVNNSVFATYLESGRVAVFRNRDLSIGFTDATFVIARSEIDYLRELRWPGTVDIGTGVVRFGRTSFVMAQALFCEGQCAAAAQMTMVMASKSTRRPIPLPDDLIALLSQWNMAAAVSA